jgi:hypothetical protein
VCWCSREPAHARVSLHRTGRVSASPLVGPGPARPPWSHSLNTRRPPADDKSRPWPRARMLTRHPHRPHTCRARAAPPCTPSPPHLSTPLPPRDSPTCSPATRPTPHTVTSQEPRQGRPWMRGAAEHYRRHFLRPFQLSEWNPR